MKPHEEWMAKAAHDLEAAKRLIDNEEPLTDAAIYHTQQCAEKALKAFLAFHEHETEKTHDLKILLDICSKFDCAFDQLKIEASFINPFATMFRYPGAEMCPDIDTVCEAIDAAEKIYDFVLARIEC